jgi:hypothetical protein
MRLVLAAAVALTLSSCQSQLLLRNDHRITVDSPNYFATVQQPVTVRWSVRDFAPPRDGHFVVFVDRSPQAPSDPLSDFRPGDRTGIYTVDTAELKLPRFLPDPNAHAVDQDHHEVTIILVAQNGRRIGESAGFVEFDVRQ